MFLAVCSNDLEHACTFGAHYFLAPFVRLRSFISILLGLQFLNRLPYIEGFRNSKT